MYSSLGGHMNPAVTLAMTWTRNISPIKGLGYILAQMLGAILAGLALSRARSVSLLFSLVSSFYEKCSVNHVEDHHKSLGTFV